MCSQQHRGVAFYEAIGTVVGNMNGATVDCVDVKIAELWFSWMSRRTYYAKIDVHILLLRPFQLLQESYLEELTRYSYIYVQNAYIVKEY